MKKIIIIAAIILTSGIAALSIGNKASVKTNTLNIQKADFAKNIATAKSDISAAD